MRGDTNPLRRAGAERTGTCTVYDPANESGPEADSADIVIDAVGLGATRRAAVAAVKPGGVIVHVGLMDAAGELDIRRMTLSEITFIGTYTRSEERRVGKERVSTCRYRWSQYHEKKK